MVIVYSLGAFLDPCQFQYGPAEAFLSPTFSLYAPLPRSPASGQPATTNGAVEIFRSVLPVPLCQVRNFIPEDPSVTPSGLTLGSALPLADEHSQRNLGLSAHRILTCVLATHVCILTRSRSTTAHAMASLHVRRSPTIQIWIRSFGWRL